MVVKSRGRTTNPSFSLVRGVRSRPVHLRHEFNPDCIVAINNSGFLLVLDAHSDELCEVHIERFLAVYPSRLFDILITVEHFTGEKRLAVYLQKAIKRILKAHDLTLVAYRSSQNFVALQRLASGSPFPRTQQAFYQMYPYQPKELREVSAHQLAKIEDLVALTEAARAARIEEKTPFWQRVDRQNTD